jgi:uncharacterized protein (DUF1697 family)
MARLVALLRGINLGAKRRVGMADLRALLEELGYEDVRTVLQSGNAVFTGPRAKAREKLEKALRERFGFDVDVVLLTMKELQAVVDADPFGAEAKDATRYFVVFLDRKPSAATLRELSEQGFAPDKLEHPGGRELYAWCPEGMQGSRLMKALGKPGLAGTATVRNWSTVNKLLE